MTKTTPTKKPATKKAPAPKTLKRALVAAQKQVQRLEHDSIGYRGRDKYPYVSAESVIEHARTVLLNNDILAYREHWEVLGMSEDGKTVHVSCEFKLEYLHTDEFQLSSVTTLARESYGQPLDLAVAASLTTSLSYWLRDLLLIPRGHQDNGLGGAAAEDTLENKVEPKPVNLEAADAAFAKASKAITDCDTLKLLTELTQKVVGHEEMTQDHKGRLLKLIGARKGVIGDEK